MEQKIITVDMSDGSVHYSDVPEAYSMLGGRALTSTYISENVDPGCDPLGAQNKLVFAPGLISGSYLSSSNRLSAGTKSPLTGGIKESNSGGVVCFKLARLGIKALVITGAVPQDNGKFPSKGLIITSTGVRSEDMPFLSGKGTYECSELIRAEYGKKAGFMIIGQAGEMMLKSACININDDEGEPCRNLGRGGLGAVMGSKGLKAVIIDDSGCKNPYSDNPTVKSKIKDFAVKLRNHPVTGEKFAMYGTVMTLMNLNGLGGLATRNFSQGEYENADKISAETIRRNMIDRGGKPAHGCMPGCTIRCSNKYVAADGKPIVGSMEFETVGLFGSNLDNPDPDAIAEMNYICNDVGIDTIEAGCALGVLCEAGKLKFGDADSYISLLREVAEGTVEGKMLGNGAVVCGKVFKAVRIPVVKGQGMAAYDPRAIKGMGVTYAVSAMGADHTAANAITLSVDHQDPNAQIQPVKKLMTQYMVLDSLGLCIFTGRVSLGEPEILKDLVGAYTGRNITLDDLYATAWKVLRLEKEFNRKAGIGDEQDDLPAFMREEPLPPLDSRFDISEDELKDFFK